MPSSSEVFGPARHVSSYYALTIPRQPNVAQLASSFAVQLGSRFAAPTVLQVPEQVDAMVPRLVFTSIHGFSNVIVSPSTIGLAISYSPDWQVAPDLCLTHLLDSVNTVAGLLNLLDERDVLYSGLQTIFELNTSLKDAELIDHLQAKLSAETPRPKLHDFLVRTTSIVKDVFFSNMTIENFRTWPQVAGSTSAFTMPLSVTLAQLRGLRLTADCNDRFGFNEKRGHRSDMAATEDHIRLAFELADAKLDTLRS